VATDAVAAGGKTDVLGGNAVLRQVGARAGNSTVINDSAGVLRDMRHSYQGIDTFGVAIASNAAGHEISPKLFGGAERPVPIDYAGPPGTVAAIPYWRVYADKFPAAEVRGKIVIVGAQASRLQDVHSTPTSGSQEMDGPEVQANIAATALAGIPLRDGPAWLNIALIVLFGLVAPLSSIRIRVWYALLVSLALAALFTLATQIAFDDGTIISYTYPLLTLVLAIIATLAVVLLGEAFERQHARDIFARFVPPDVVDEVLARTDDDFRLGGAERDCTVLFTDLRGFTSFSESQPATKVIEVINVYLNEMTEAVLDAGGTLISYIGDGILALFGAPIDQPDHADRALVAAREMLGPRLTRFNDWLREQGYERRLRGARGIHGDRRPRQHRLAARGPDEGHAAHAVRCRDDAGVHARRTRRPRVRQRPGDPWPGRENGGIHAFCSCRCTAGKGAATGGRAAGCVEAASHGQDVMHECDGRDRRTRCVTSLSCTRMYSAAGAMRQPLTAHDL
jgi:adenylate cyclase